MNDNQKRCLTCKKNNENIHSAFCNSECQKEYLSTAPTRPELLTIRDAPSGKYSIIKREGTR